MKSACVGVLSIITLVCSVMMITDSSNITTVMIYLLRMHCNTCA